jgi:hypothetical protein
MPVLRADERFDEPLHVFVKMVRSGSQFSELPFRLFEPIGMVRLILKKELDHAVDFFRRHRKILVIDPQR